MRRQYRLRDKRRFQQVRRQGRSYKHRLIVLVLLPNKLSHSRFGFTASKRIGNAVKRNRVRRLMREAVRLQWEDIAPGWDVVCIARQPIADATFQEVQAACQQLLSQAGLLRDRHRESHLQSDQTALS